MLGFGRGPMDFTIYLTDDDKRVAADLLHGANISSPYIALVPGTRWETKCWPPDRFGAVAASLQQSHGMKSILVGGKDDISIADRAVQNSSGAAVNLCGKTTLRQAAALIERAAIVVTADSTPMHLAAAFSRPLVAVFGPTNPRRTGPFGSLADVIRIPLDCSPCYFRKLRQCPHLHRCMDDLNASMVSQAVISKLNSDK